MLGWLGVGVQVRAIARPGASNHARLFIEIFPNRYGMLEGWGDTPSLILHSRLFGCRGGMTFDLTVLFQTKEE